MTKQFIFGTKGNVIARTRYQPDLQDAGFVTETEWREQPLLQIFELNSGFSLPYWYKEENISLIEEDENGCFINSDKQVAKLWERDGEAQPGGRRNIPLYFKAELPEPGNYRVTISLTARVDEPELKVFAGRRHLTWFGALKKGQWLCRTFTVNLCDIILNSKDTAYTDKTLDLAVTGRQPVLEEILIEKADCSTVFLAGDSTMAASGPNLKISDCPTGRLPCWRWFILPPCRRVRDSVGRFGFCKQSDSHQPQCYLLPERRKYIEEIRVCCFASKNRGGYTNCTDDGGSI